MALTRRQLKEMQLPDETIETIIAAHAQSIAGLKEERDAWREAAGQTEAAREERDALMQQVAELTGARQAAEQLQNELDSLRAAQTAQIEERLRTEAAQRALIQRGANEQALPLLLAAADLTGITVCEGVAEGAEALADGLAQAYPAVFAQPVRIPTGSVCPPSGGASVMTAQELEAMSPEEINNNWNAVKTALMKGV